MAQVATVRPGELDGTHDVEGDKVAADLDGQPVRVGAHHVVVAILKKKFFEKKNSFFIHLFVCC